MWYTCNWVSVEDFVEQFMTTVFCVFANCNVDGVTWWTLTSWIDFELANYWNSADICFGSMQFGCFSRNISIFSCVCVCIVDLIWRKVCKYTDNQLVIPHNLPFFFSMCWPDSEFVSITLSQSAASLGQSLIISSIIWDHQSIRMIITASIDCLLAWLNQWHTHTHNQGQFPCSSNWLFVVSVSAMWYINSVHPDVPLICIFSKRIFLTATRILSRLISSI